MASLYLAKMFSLYFVIVSVIMLFRRDYIISAAAEMVKHPGVQLLTAVMTLILGIVLVVFHTIWGAHWVSVVTVLCWLTLVKGVARMGFPEKMESMLTWFNSDSFYYGSIVIMLIVGCYLGYYGFVA